MYRPVAGRAGGGSFGGVVPGIAMLAASCGMLWWNEGRTLREERMLREAKKAVLSIDGDSPLASIATGDDTLLH
eukprot:7151709-Prymnesium_polylepis.1